MDMAETMIKANVLLCPSTYIAHLSNFITTEEYNSYMSLREKSDKHNI
jgi:hypothetical protein